MNGENPSPEDNIFDSETWAALPATLEKLPEPVSLSVWGDAEASLQESQAVTLCQTLAGRFDTLFARTLPRRDNYPYYPVIGVMGMAGGEEADYGVRLIGLPTGYQMTSLIAAIQAVSFRGMTLEPLTRIRLSQMAKDLSTDIMMELMTSAEDEGGPLMAKILFGLAVASPRLRAFLIMSDQFPEANVRYSVDYIPHTVVNSRIHVQGVVDEESMLRHLATAVKNR